MIFHVKKTCISVRILDVKFNNDNNLTLNTTRAGYKNVFKRPPFEISHSIPKKGSEELEMQLSSLKHSMFQMDIK